MKIRFRLHSVVIPGLLATLVSGCTTAPTTATTSAPATLAIDEAAATPPDEHLKPQRSRWIRIGMHQPQVLALMGEPDRREPADDAKADSGRSTWTYTFRHPPVYRDIAAATQAVPYEDPLTGQLIWVDEPVPDQQRIDRTETLVLTFAGPRLVDLDRKLAEYSTYRN